MYKYDNTTNRFPSNLSSYQDGKLTLLTNTMDFTLFSREIAEDQLVQIDFTHESNDSFQTYCVFWDTESLEWSQEGCETKQHENGTTCECNHLTSFGILFGGSPDDTFGKVIETKYYKKIG